MPKDNLNGSELEQRIHYVSTRANTDVLSDLMDVGILKAQNVSRTDPKILELDRSMFDQTQALLTFVQGTAVEERVVTYQELLSKYIEDGSSLDPLVQFVGETFKPFFGGKTKFVEDINTFGPGLVVANHNTHTPEIDVVDWEESRILHDVGPVVTRIGMDIALEGSGIAVNRLVKSPNPSDFYKRVMSDLGNVLLSEEGTDQIARQMRETIDTGNVPALSPEGGFRVFDKWNTGPIVLAAKAGVTHLHLVAHSPLISLFAPKMDFNYIGMREIPQEVLDAVKDNEKGPVKEFSESVRVDFATAIQDLPYPNVYKQHVAQYAKAK